MNKRWSETFSCNQDIRGDREGEGGREPASAERGWEEIMETSGSERWYYFTLVPMRYRGNNGVGNDRVCVCVTLHGYQPVGGSESIGLCQ